jgi:PAS domain S-box-containing protein
MKRTSFFLRLFLGNLLLVALIIGLGAYFAYRSLNQHYLEQAQARQADALRMARQAIQQHWPASASELQALCRTLVPSPAMQLSVIDLRGKILAENHQAHVPVGNPIAEGRPEILTALDGRTGTSVRTVQTGQKPVRLLAGPIRRDKNTVALVRVAMPIHSMYSQGGFVTGLVLWSLLVTFAAAGVLGLLVSWIWYRPLRQITDNARRIAQGSLSERPLARGSGELGELSEALNEMRRTVSTQLDLISEQGENLRTILANLREGVIALDSDGRIAFMNDTAHDLLAPDETEPAGQHFQTIIRLAELVDVYNELVSDNQPINRPVELALRGRRVTLSVQASRIDHGRTSSIATLLVVHDITEISRTATMKAEFVANASHELRTPLATIRAAVDNLLEMGAEDPEAVERLAAMIDRHVNRLEDMTNDLLDLHTAEARQLPPRWEEVELGTLVWWAQTHFVQRAREKNVRLTVEADRDDFPIRTDRKLVVLILQNLLDNALKFTPAGGEVACRIESADREVALTVRDTGCGIPPEDRTKVFDRFFQANTSRTGEPRQRGTGLGLAIVKHASDRLGATIDLDSEIGQGTTVTLRIPSREAEPSAQSALSR